MSSLTLQDSYLQGTITGSVLPVYYTSLLNAVQRSVHLHGPSRLPAVDYSSIMTVAKHMMAAVKESGFFFASDSCLLCHSTSSPVTYQPQCTRLLSDVKVFFGRLFL